MNVPVHTCDVLVVGSGAAGMRAALEAHLQGARVILAVKGAFSAIGVRGAGASASGLCNHSGMLYAHKQELHAEPDRVYAEAIQLGLGLADPRLVRTLIEDSRRNRLELAKYNIFWPHVADRGVRAHGVPITSGLAAQIVGRGVTVHESTAVFHLLHHAGHCSGAVAISETTGELAVYQAGAVILATGGNGQLFRHNLNASCVTGDGYALGYRAGAKLTNLEFLQVFIAIVAPTRNNLQIWNWAQPPRFLNREGVEFLDRHCPPSVTSAMVMEEHNRHDPASTRDRHSRYLESAILAEVREGRGTSHDGVWMDFRGLEHTLARPTAEWLQYRGIESNTQCIEVSVCHHCSNGGFVVDVNAQTTVPGLYAIGETMGGAWGADRRGGFMLASTQVFGARAGISAAQGAARAGRTADPAQAGLDEALDRVARLFRGGSDETPRRLRQALQYCNWTNLLFGRSAASLTRVLDEVEQQRGILNLGLRTTTEFDRVSALELDNMLTVSEMIARVSLLRTESRGAHYRTDFPERDDPQWRRNIGIHRHDGQMRLDTFYLDPAWDEDREGERVSQRWG